MSHTQFEISKTLSDLGKMAPSGYAVGLHVQYTTTKFLFQTYKKEWLDFYSQNGLVMSDPIVAWCFENTGAMRWSNLNDPAGVLDQASAHGMRYGVVYATETGGSRSMAGLSRNDREYTDDEITTISEAIERLHVETADHAELAPEAVKQLKKMSIMVTHPGA